MNLVLSTAESIVFGRFQVLPRRRVLLADDKPVKLGGRAFDLLMVLIETPGAVVSKDDLLARIWPDRVVSESSLQTQILALRQVFGAERDLIRTVAGRGYQFTGEVQIVSPDLDNLVTGRLPVAAHGAVAVPTNLPQPVSELIGRDAEVEEISNLVRAGRLVTLTGAGGIGKTRLAVAVARRLLSEFPDGVWLAEFSPLSDPNLVPATLAAAARLELGGEISAQRVAQAFGTRRLLLVLDTCEHVIDAATAMAEAVLQAGSAAHIIATSREPLRAEGERLYRVPPLAVPAEDADDLLEYGAVRLFVERARASATDLAPDRGLAATIATICRRLDGIPLAIEMAAARVAVFGVEEIARRLDDRLRLLTGGMRTALPRHQTLRATLDWSYELLAEPERLLLRRLAIFAGAVDLEAVSAVAASAEIASPETVDGIYSLIAKSLIVVEVDTTLPRYRLLDTTRAYALEKLAESGEREQLARRHAEYYRDLFERAGAELEKRPTDEWLGDYGRQIDNLRAALDWSFSSVGDPSIGSAIAVAAVPLWMQASLMEESRRRIEQALGSLASQTTRDKRREMQLLAAWGVSLLLTRGGVAEMNAAWTGALKFAEELDDADYRLRALWGLFIDHLTRGDYRTALACAERFRRLTAGAAGSTDRFMGERMIGTALHILGNQNDARRHFEQMLDLHLAPDHRPHVTRFPFDQQVQGRSFFSRVLWLQGFADQAMRLVARTVDLSRAIDHSTGLFTVLILSACPVALLAGDLVAADRYLAMLLDLSDRRAVQSWNVWGQCFKGILMARQGDIAAGLRLQQTALASLPEAAFHLQYTAFLGELAQSLSLAGETAKALSTIDEALARCARNEEGWQLAELLRLKGELLLMHGAPGAAATAKDYFQQALDRARQQHVLSWELRAVTSFARLLRNQGRASDGMALLQPVYDRFTEGFGTADLKTADALLRELR